MSVCVCWLDFIDIVTDCLLPKLTVASSTSFLPLFYVTTFAGTTTHGSTDGTGSVAQFYSPYAACVDTVNQTLYVSDYQMEDMRKISMGAVVTKIAKGIIIDVYIVFYLMVVATAFFFDFPMSCAVDAAQNVYVGQFKSIALINPTQTTASVFIGGSLGYAEGSGTNAKFNTITAMVFDQPRTKLYICDSANKKIRFITIQTVTASLFLSVSACFGLVFDLTYSTLYSSGGNIIYQLQLSTKTSVAFTGATTSGWIDGSLGVARFNSPQGLCLDPDGNLIVADYNNNNIRMVNLATSTVSTIMGLGIGMYFTILRLIYFRSNDVCLIGSSAQPNHKDGTSISAGFYHPVAVALINNAIFVTDYYNNEIRKLACLQGK